jgi:hypothetical protein
MCSKRGRRHCSSCMHFCCCVHTPWGKSSPLWPARARAKAMFGSNSPPVGSKAVGSMPCQRAWCTARMPPATLFEGLARCLHLCFSKQASLQHLPWHRGQTIPLLGASLRPRLMSPYTSGFVHATPALQYMLIVMIKQSSQRIRASPEMPCCCNAPEPSGCQTLGCCQPISP